MGFYCIEYDTDYNACQKECSDNQEYYVKPQECPKHKHVLMWKSDSCCANPEVAVENEWWIDWDDIPRPGMK